MGKYTEEQRQFIKDNIEGTKYRVLANMFNAKYGTNKTRENIKSYCRRHGLRNNLTSEQTYFKEGHDLRSSKPIGSEYINHEGNVMIKFKDDLRLYESYKNWKAKKIYVWEKHYGHIPVGYSILNLDGNKLNCDIDNLILIENSENSWLNKHNYVFNYPELTIVAIHFIRLRKQRIKREKELRELRRKY